MYHPQSLLSVYYFALPLLRFLLLHHSPVPMILLLTYPQLR
jgi:hypothetical protein